MKVITVNGIECRIHEVTGFLVSEDGQVFGISSNGAVRRMPSAVDATTGYDKVTWYNPATQKSRPYAVHQLVAELWVPNPEGKRYIDHIDRNKLNNAAWNLHYVSQKENNLNTERSDKHAAEYGFHSCEDTRRYKREWARKHYIPKSK